MLIGYSSREVPRFQGNARFNAWILTIGPATFHTWQSMIRELSSNSMIYKEAGLAGVLQLAACHPLRSGSSELGSGTGHLRAPTGLGLRAIKNSLLGIGRLHCCVWHKVLV